ncbi:hypothetical protein HK104_000899, partial [Borealophlyctis nickersoniae]
MWVGNLPAGVSEEEIRMHFWDLEIESIANLTRSRCAFLNLRSKSAVDLAVTRYNNTILNGCLIVCRPRLSTSSPSVSPSVTPPQTRGAKILSEYTALNSGVEKSGTYQFEDRYFIMKSLSTGDLDIARRTGYWATQLKNEPILNKAFY